MHLAVKFGYDGSFFTGYQRGNGSRSVEDSILKVFSDYGISDGLSSAARTDRGVSAAGNVIHFSTGMNVQKVMGILNAKVRNAIFHSYSQVSSEFRVRHSEMKHYRYLLNANDCDITGFERAMKKFEGTHDFTLFAKKDKRSPVRSVDSVRIGKMGGLLIVDVFGSNFVWNQIRSMVGYAMHNTGISDPDPFSEVKRSWPIAPAEQLILMDISYKGIQFTNELNSKKARLWESQLWKVRMQSSVLSNILSEASGEGAPD